MNWSSSSELALSISTLKFSTLPLKKLNAQTAGTATKRPNAVVMSASAMPAEIAAMPPEPGERHAREGVDDAEGSPEEAHEGRGRADRREARKPALQVGEVHGGRAVDRTLGGFDGGVAVALDLARLHLVLPLLQARLQHLGEV